MISKPVAVDLERLLFDRYRGPFVGPLVGRRTRSLATLIALVKVSAMRSMDGLSTAKTPVNPDLSRPSSYA
jgi:hypothetical protein